MLLGATHIDEDPHEYLGQPLARNGTRASESKPRLVEAEDGGRFIRETVTFRLAV
jgi:hypothetical protein